MTREDAVRSFLDDFFIKLRVFGILFRDERKKNTKTLLKLEISPNKRREIIESLIFLVAQRDPKSSAYHSMTQNVL